jgi:HD superfamily phosphohydrolase
MFIQVYFHKTRRYFDGLLVKSLKELLPDGKFPEKVDDYLKWDDIRVLAEMRNSDQPFSRQYLNREPMKCIRETSAHAERSENMLWGSIRDDINKEIGEGTAVFDETDKKAHKLIPESLLAEYDAGKEIRVIDRHSGEDSNILEVSLLLQGITKEIHICRIYADRTHAERAEEIVDQSLKINREA